MANIDVVLKSMGINSRADRPLIQITLSKREAIQIVNGRENASGIFRHDLQKAVNYIENEIEPTR